LFIIILIGATCCNQWFSRQRAPSRVRITVQRTTNDPMNRLLLAVLVLACAPLSPQETGLPPCAAADSVVGPPPRRLSLMHRYDRITDTTQLEVRKEEVKILSSSPSSSLRLVTSFEGQSLRAGSPATTLFQVVVATTANRGGLLSQTASADQGRPG